MNKNSYNYFSAIMEAMSSHFEATKKVKSCITNLSLRIEWGKCALEFIGSVKDIDIFYYTNADHMPMFFAIDSDYIYVIQAARNDDNSSSARSIGISELTAEDREVVHRANKLLETAMINHIRFDIKI